MPFERRSDVQVLEDDGSEKLLRRTAANRAFSTLLRKTQPRNPCKGPRSEKTRKETPYLSSGIYCSVLIDS